MDGFFDFDFFQFGWQEILPSIFKKMKFWRCLPLWASRLLTRRPIWFQAWFSTVLRIQTSDPKLTSTSQNRFQLVLRNLKETIEWNLFQPWHTLGRFPEDNISRVCFKCSISWVRFKIWNWLSAIPFSACAVNHYSGLELGQRKFPMAGDYHVFLHHLYHLQTNILPYA